MPDATPQPFAEIAVPVPVPRTFHYRVPDALDAVTVPGVRVEVPFGPRKVRAYCVGRSATAAVAKVKDVLAVLDRAPLLDAPLLALGRWLARTYHTSLGEVLEAALPAAVRNRSQGRRVRIARLAVPSAHATEAAAGLRAKAASQAAVLEALTGREGNEAGIGELARVARGPGRVVAALVKRGLVVVESRLIAPPPEVALVGPAAAPAPPPPTLTGAQTDAVAAIGQRLATRAGGVFLLHGVTGSGKTEVYLRAIADAVAGGGQAILLVPEIALTPQTVGRVTARFPRVAVLHSHLADPDRRRAWQQIQAGAVDVVVGARSAVFAPCPRLRLMVVDEEHETSFKQESSPRYHARDAAVARGREAGAVVVLGTATPSLESWQAALDRRYALLQLPHRVTGGPLPPVEVVDLQGEWDAGGGVRALSRPLSAALDEVLAHGEQAILFLNRRGFSTTLRCPRCGHVWKCTRCDVALTYHKAVDRFLCHYCGAVHVPPTACPACGHGKLRHLGTGTQRLEDELASAFPRARIARMDSDSMRRLGSYETTLAAVREGRVDVLIGTQMVAKGHDLPGVTLVGVVYADVGLHLPDYRAAERTFQIVAQVAGRAGRGSRPGRVIVQTVTPDHYSITAAAGHDFEGFATRELAARKAAGYPPYTRLARIVCAAVQEPRAVARSQAVAAGLAAAVAGAGAELLGPAPAPYPRLMGRFRHHLLIKAPDAAAVEASLAPLREGPLARGQAGVSTTVDVDPVSML